METMITKTEAMTTKETAMMETTMLGMTAVETVIKGADRQTTEDRTDIIFRCINSHMIRSHLI